MQIKKEIKYLIYGHLILAVFLTYKLFDLITLLYDDSFTYALSDAELNPSAANTNKNHLIPKIIHQTYKSNQIPEIWKDGQKKCIELNPDYQYILWTDEMARDFISEEYPWFLKTFDSYKFPIQRADAIRYFILYHYGGVYIDLDDGCNRNLDNLLNVPAFARKTLPTGISNDIIGSVPHHPFFLKVIGSLSTYNKNWLVPYITIMFSTGPLFLSTIWKQYTRWGNPPSDVVRILMPDDYKNGANAFFKISKGSSWHNDDAKVLLFMARHIFPMVVLGFLVAFVLFFIEYMILKFLLGPSLPKIFKKLFNNFNNFTSYNSLSDINNNNNSNGYKKLNFKRFKNRKDSNLPVALDIDLEKNVSSIENIQEETN